MRPLRISMQGFGAFRDPTDVDLTDVELVALVGPTGSGKSTIIDAVTFALYGSVARYDDNKLVAPVINQTSTEARVALEFELTGRRYTAVRVVRRTKTGASTKEARLECGDDVLAADARGMTAAVTGLLGLDVDQFNRTVVLPQGRFADFLHDNPADRQATLRQLLGLDLYRRMGQAARARAASSRDQADALRPDLDAAGELTDEHRGLHEALIARIAAARGWFDGTIEQATELRRRVEAGGARLAELDRHLTLLDAVTPPAGLDELDARVSAASGARTAAAEALAAARQARRDAADAVATGPDLTTVTVQLRLHDDLATLAGAHERLAGELATARAAHERAAAAAAAVVAAQQELDERATTARAAEDTARAALAGVPSTDQLDAWLALHRRHDAAASDVAQLERARDTAAAVLAPLDDALRDAATAEAGAVARRDDARQRAGAVALAPLLAVGDPCPLCLQEVHDLPEHHVDADLAAADAAVAAAAAVTMQAAAARDAAAGELVRAEAQLDAARSVLASLAAELDGVEPVDALLARWDESQRVATALAAAIDASRAAVAAADAHRCDPAHRDVLAAADTARDRVTALTASEGDAATRLDDVRGRLAGAPSVDELVARRDAATRLLTAHQEAQQVCDLAEAADELAARELDSARAAVRDATTQLQAIRDRVAVLAPPALAGEGIAAAWEGLTLWAGQCRGELSNERTTLATRREQDERELRRLDAGIHELCSEVLGEVPAELPLARLGELLARKEAEAEAGLRAFDERRARLAELRARVAALDEQRAVADELARHLRADGFEGWLMEAALHQLVERATVRLYELSGGQYSLELDDRSFAVRDHANADELRSARTLSGGETFLASLSLALALADATAELAPEGAPQIESIFLDEGFGTLDADTLDTVAAAIEELGASGRLVAIVTHIRDLADRMPVRLEVTKASGTSTVERVEI